MNTIYTFTVSFLFLIIVTGFSYADNNFVVSIKSHRAVGTAFYIGEGKFVTNFHIVGKDYLDPAEQVSYTIDILTNHEDIVVQKILHLDAKNDLAIVQVDRAYIKTIEQTLQPAKLSKNPYLVKNGDYKAISIQYKQYNDYKKVKPVLSSSTLKLDSQSKYIMFNTFMQSGMSGSPVLNKDDQIIGVLCCATETVGYAIPIFKVINLLKQASLECEVFSECLAQEIQYLKQQAEDGDLDAQYELGQFYLLGNKGVIQDVQLAVNLFNKSALQNHMYAQRFLGSLYINAEAGIKKDLKLGLYWLEKSAKNGNLDSQYTLGCFYLLGNKGVTQDVQLALKLLNKSAKNGNLDSQYALRHFYHSGRNRIKKNTELEC